MSKKRPETPSVSRAVGLERAARLYQLVRLLGAGPQTRAAIVKKLRIDIRTFYRDLELLRLCGIEMSLLESRYRMRLDKQEAMLRLPIPDPALNLGEAKTLADGRTPVHNKLKRLIKAMTK